MVRGVRMAHLRTAHGQAPWSGAAFVFGAANTSSFYQLEVPNTS